MSIDLTDATATEIDVLADQAVADALREQTLTDLATSSPVEYDLQREAAAKRLGIRVSTLDAEIERRRPKSETGKDGGRGLLLSEPEPWLQSVDMSVTLDAILGTLKRFVVVADSAANAIALWIVHTYAHDSANVSPILAINSPEKRCGKTTLLELLTALVIRALPTSNVTPATVFRGVEAFHPTLLIDEADTFLDGDELRGILNSGHRRSTAVVLRTVGDAHEVKAFSTWCPKAIAAIGKLPDTLQDRSIVVPMRRRAADETVEGLRFDRLAVELEPLRRQIARWAQDNRDSLALAEPHIPTGIDDRAADNWRALLAIADAAAGRDWPELARQSAIDLCGTRDEDDDSARTMLLADIRSLFKERSAEKLASAEIVSALGEMETRPWPEWKTGKPITTRQLAKLLKPFNVEPKNIRTLAGIAKGYTIDQFQDSFARYLPPQSATPLQGNKHNGLDDFQSATRLTNVADEKAAKCMDFSDVADVADGPSEEGERRI